MSLESRQLTTELRALGSPERAVGVARFFRTGPGAYGEGDRFLGLKVPQIRSLVRVYRGLPLDDVSALLRSEWHEERLCALLLLVDAHARAEEQEQLAIRDLYLANTAFINNWDLVDASAEYVVGPHIVPDDLTLLDRLAASPSVWERRIAMLATFHHIKHRTFGPALHVAERLIDDRHDLIHKAVGWMLREIGKRDQAVEETFLRQYLPRLSRTTLRYAIERFDEPLRQRYLAGNLR